MSTIVNRAAKGSPLTNTEVDSNFSNLNTDKAETSATTNELNSLDMSASSSSSGQVLTSNGTGALPTWQDAGAGGGGGTGEAIAMAIALG